MKMRNENLKGMELKKEKVNRRMEIDTNFRS